MWQQFPTSPSHYSTSHRKTFYIKNSFERSVPQLLISQPVTLTHNVIVSTRLGDNLVDAVYGQYANGTAAIQLIDSVTQEPLANLSVCLVSPLTSDCAFFAASDKTEFLHEATKTLVALDIIEPISTLEDSDEPLRQAYGINNIAELYQLTESAANTVRAAYGLETVS